MIDTLHQEKALLHLRGTRTSFSGITTSRIRWVIAGAMLAFAIVFGRLIWLGINAEASSSAQVQSEHAVAHRPDILDRNGAAIALNIRVPSLFAEPRRIIDVDEATESIRKVLPDLDPSWLYSTLSSDRGFAWIARGLTPAIEQRMMQEGVPGLGFVGEVRRLYPGSNETAHLLGAVDIDNNGIAGLERFLDDRGVMSQAGKEAITLGIDIRIQHVLNQELAIAMERFGAIAAAGAVMDVDTGEIVAMVSLPDFDPHNPSSILVGGRFNRMTAGKFEVGSIFKTITLAAALESGRVSIADLIDARTRIRFGRHTISDYHGQYRMLSVPEVFTYSSNIGTIRLVEAMGKDYFREFISRLGFDERSTIELPEVTGSSIPATFSDVGAATASFGHGLSVTPIQMLSALSALVNGGRLIPPTLFERSVEEARGHSIVAMSEQTSDRVRYLLRLNALQGGARRADEFAQGYRLGGKTGTAEKVIDGRYSRDKNVTFFTSVFPMDAPRYAMLILLDEPSSERVGGPRTAGWNAGEISGRIVARIAPMLGVLPDFNPALDQALAPDGL